MKESYELYAEARFSAAHTLIDYPGDCARLHGHNWSVRAYVQAHGLDSLGMAIDFRSLKTHLKEVVSELDHAYLNELKPFRGVNPTSENIARYIFEEMKKRLSGKGVRVSRVEVAETPETGVIYREEE
ncbi:MAG TPA: 6-carboxytetrahydropterin synthase QueD [Syntrophales bacterium]|nr:6-carboxytetrahydropterin synthase QueD [Syntrophales bacterium]HOL59657.1 6-carboxytetrahydropterin synthase QueD [Syntrophales bacterium]HPO35803.1 6-carboxytetrahydropterin synthase QueD [Syntrophales bacterium]